MGTRTRPSGARRCRLSCPCLRSGRILGKTSSPRAVGRRWVLESSEGLERCSLLVLVLSMTPSHEVLRFNLISAIKLARTWAGPKPGHLQELVWPLRRAGRVSYDDEVAMTGLYSIGEGRIFPTSHRRPERRW